MADSDYDRRDDDDRPRRRDDDDRPRRRDDDPPKKSGGALKVVLIILGVIGVICVGGCAGAYFWMQSWGEGLLKGMETAADTQVNKIAGGDMTAAYNGMSSTYKSTHTKEKFEEAMKAAKLTDVQSVAWTKPTNQQTGGQGAVKLSGTATLKSGGTIPVTATVRLLPDFKTWEVDDVTSP